MLSSIGTALINLPNVHAVSSGIIQVQAPTRYTAFGGFNVTGTLVAPPTSGNILIATTALQNDGTPGYFSSIIQSGVTWTKIISSNSTPIIDGIYSNFIISCEIWLGVVNTGASASFIAVPIVGSGLGHGIVFVAEYSGVTSVIDSYANSSNTTGVTTSTGLIYSTTTAPELWIGAVASTGDNNGQTNPQNDFSLTDGVHPSVAYWSLAYLEKTSLVTSSVSSGTTIDSNAPWVGAVIAVKGEPTTYQYTFYGVYDENIDANILMGNANVTAFYNDGTVPYSFDLNGSTVFAPANKPLYFYYDIWVYANTSDTALHREYWLSTDENNGTYYVYGDQQGLANIVFNVRALGGAGLGSYVIVERIIGGTLQVVEKRPVDITGAVVMSLQPFTIYSVSIEGTDSTSSTTFGNINTYTTPITLTVSALSFPSDVLQQYKYLRIYAYRSSDASISIIFQDTDNQTLTVSYDIKLANGTVAYSGTHIGEYSFTDVWLGSSNTTTYYLSATVTQVSYGTTTFNQILLSINDETSPIDLSFLGDWNGIDATQILWALIVIIIFGSFSVVNAYVGAFAGTATAAIFMYLGWLHISSGVVVLAFSMVILIGISYWKHRGG